MPVAFDAGNPPLANAECFQVVVAPDARTDRVESLEEVPVLIDVPANDVGVDQGRPSIAIIDVVAGAVYHASIAAALAAHCQRITRKTDDELVKDLNCPWIDEPTRPMARRAGAQLAGSASNEPRSRVG